MKRNETITIRVTPEEKADLEKKAESAHMSLSTWLRKLGLEATKPAERKVKR
jgi:predicted HicB family RNase H-like nuclease